MFIRILFVSTGIAKVLAGCYLLIITIFQLNNLRNITRYAIILFLSGYTLNGICWLVLSAFKRFWNNNAGNTIG